MLFVEADMMMQGQLIMLGAARIDGRFYGDIVCTSIEIGADGFVEGNITTERLVVAGQIVGIARARVVHLHGSAIVEGELYQERLSMDESATLVGESRRDTRFEMPAGYLALQARERRMEDEFQRLSAESRVKRANEADQSRIAFEKLRAKFPAPRTQP